MQIKETPIGKPQIKLKINAKNLILKLNEQEISTINELTIKNIKRLGTTQNAQIFIAFLTLSATSLESNTKLSIKIMLKDKKYRFFRFILTTHKIYAIIKNLIA